MNLIRRQLFHPWGGLIGFYALSSQQKDLAVGFQNTPRSPLQPLIKPLRHIKNPVCLSTAERLEKGSGPGVAFHPHLRSTNLDLSDAQLLANSLTSIQQQIDLTLNSFSVSYNPGIGTDGVQALLPSFPDVVSEIGMVGCQLRDDVGKLLIQLMTRCRNLKMICVEGNLFSTSMRSQIASAGKKLEDCITII